MSMPTDTSREVIPAQIEYVAIYNPTLGTKDEGLENQIVYYFSSKCLKQTTRQRTRSRGSKDNSRRQRTDEQLRQIGLGQGMVEFAKNFSGGQSVDTIDTAKSRIILHELETNWWILASINFTVIPGISESDKTQGDQGTVEFSSRNVKPAALLLADLLRANSTFLLHHAASISILFKQTTRTRFLSLLGRYWDIFLSTWNVFMHGNPINNIYNGIKIAACGELGVGVGEEDHGSGEREVLEGFVDRVPGVLDMVVAKFENDTAQLNFTTVLSKEPNSQNSSDEHWIGAGNDPGSEDGAIFLGTGFLSTTSLRDVTHWVEDLYRWGPYTYGIINDPSSESRSKSSKGNIDLAQKPLLKSHSKLQGSETPRKSRNDESYDTLPTVDSVAPVRHSTKNESLGVLQVSKTRNKLPSLAPQTSDSKPGEGYNLGNYLKFGYGTHWSFIRNFSMAQTDASSLNVSNSFDSAQNQLAVESESDQNSHPSGYFLIGQTGNIQELVQVDPKGADQAPVLDSKLEERDSRLLLRTLTLKLRKKGSPTQAQAGINIDPNKTGRVQTLSTGLSDETASEISLGTPDDDSKFLKLSVVVYVHKPFIFVFLFNPDTEGLKSKSLYSSLQHQIQPIIKPLLVSTSYRAPRPLASTSESSNTSTYDLIWDPNNITITSTVPNIPDPFDSQSSSTNSKIWSRAEALNTHMQIIKAYTSSRYDSFQLERTCKTSQGWWIVWTKVFNPGSEQSDCRILNSMSSRSSVAEDSLGISEVDRASSHSSFDLQNHVLRRRFKEVLLIRRATDYTSSRSVSRLSTIPPGSQKSWTFEPGKLVQGIGIDTKQYIEGLLNLNL